VPSGPVSLEQCRASLPQVFNGKMSRNSDRVSKRSGEAINRHASAKIVDGRVEKDGYGFLRPPIAEGQIFGRVCHIFWIQIEPPAGVVLDAHVH